MNPISKEQVIAAYQRAPEAVRNAFNSEVTASIVMDMKTKYRLHVDIAGNLGTEIGYMLLGLRSPAEFFGNLMLSGTEQETAKAIMEEVNARIFIPLKNQMRTTTQQVPPVSYQSTPEPVPSAPPIVPVPALDYVPTAPTLPGSPVPAPMPVPSAPVAAAPLPESAIPAETAYQPAPVAPAPAMSASIPLKKDYGSDPYREPIS